MKLLTVSGLLAGLLALSACSTATTGGVAYSGDNGGSYFDNGNDVSFLDQGSLTCPAGTVQAGLQGSAQYPLRCGPQSQIVPN